MGRVATLLPSHCASLGDAQTKREFQPQECDLQGLHQPQYGEGSLLAHYCEVLHHESRIQLLQKNC